MNKGAFIKRHPYLIFYQEEHLFFISFFISNRAAVLFFSGEYGFFLRYLSNNRPVVLFFQENICTTRFTAAINTSTSSLVL